MLGPNNQIYIYIYREKSWQNTATAENKSYSRLDLKAHTTPVTESPQYNSANP